MKHNGDNTELAITTLKNNKTTKDTWNNTTMEDKHQRKATEHEQTNNETNTAKKQ